jgi:RNA polymerase primary sigma factor
MAPNRKNKQFDHINRGVSRAYGYDDDLLGKYLTAIGKYNILTPEKELYHAKKAHNGSKKDKDILITRNLKLVVKVGKKYFGKSGSLTALDILQEGNLGLIKAVDRYDPYKLNPENGKPYRFSTYATWWIKQKITKTIQEKSRNIRIPGYLQEDYLHCIKSLHEYNCHDINLNKDQLVELVSVRTGFKENKIKQIVKLYESADKTVSLDKTVNKSERGTTIGDLVKGLSSEEVINDVDRNCKKSLLEDLIDNGFNLLGVDFASVRSLRKKINFTSNEKTVLAYRLALYGVERQYSLAEIGDNFKQFKKILGISDLKGKGSLTRERIRVIERKGLIKLKKIIKIKSKV